MTCNWQSDNLRTFNWDVGCQLSVFTCNILLPDESNKTSSFEWLANEFIENVPWKLMEERSKYSSDVKLVKVEGKFPLNWLLKISRTLRWVKWLRHWGRWPSKLFELRSYSKRFLKLHISEPENKRSKFYRMETNHSEFGHNPIQDLKNRQKSNCLIILVSTNNNRVMWTYFSYNMMLIANAFQ